MRRAVARAMAAQPAVPTDLYALDEGTGPALLLLHGVGANHTVWNAMIPRLLPGFRVIAPDLRGHGRSPSPPGSAYTFDEHVGDLLRLLDTKSVPAAHFVGLSAGALLALRAGLDRPTRCRSVTMIGGAAYTDAHTRSIAERWAETYAKEGPDRFALRLLKDLYYPDWIEAHMDFADRVRKEVRDQDFGPATRWATEVATFDERARIATLSAPALIIQAMDDQVVDASHGRILRQSIPGSQIRILAQTGHMIPVERPAEAAESIRSFVRSVEERRGPPSRA
ncbi:MAG: alpha/beta fold hydrolase [Thermoplasmata archaeon]|nr:alpha/beta hydrolase [Thermoplasmata archaeon]